MPNLFIKTTSIVDNYLYHVKIVSHRMIVLSLFICIFDYVKYTIH